METKLHTGPQLVQNKLVLSTILSWIHPLMELRPVSHGFDDAIMNLKDERSK